MSDHVLMCDCLDCMGGGPMAGAGVVRKESDDEKRERTGRNHWRSMTMRKLNRCQRGHIFDAANTRILRGTQRGQRRCIECQREAQRAYRKRHRKVQANT